MYAIIETGGKQYKVSVGDVIFIEKIDGEINGKVVFDKVLAINDTKLDVGNPYLSNRVVNATIVRQFKDKKVIVYRYKRKSGYHKKNGHRQQYTEVKIDSIA